MAIRGWVTLTLTVLSAIAILVTLIGRAGRFHPLFELFTNTPRVIFVVALLGLVVAGLARLPVQAGAFAVVAVVFGVQLVPLVFPGDARTEGEGSFRALQYNIYFGNEDIAAMTELIQSSDADVIALHEITTEQWADLEPRLSDWPHAISEPWDGPEPQLGGGMVLLSRTPIEQIDVDPEASILGRPVLAGTTELAGRETVVVGLHPHASRHEAWKAETRERQLDAVVELLDAQDGPAIILTDLNMTPTSSSYKRFIDELEWEDPHRSVGWVGSWPNWAGSYGLPIDHVLASPEIAIHDIASIDGAGSDHRALLADLSLGS